MSKTRRVVQIIFLALFLFFLFMDWTLYKRDIPTDVFINLDPVAMGAAMISGRYFNHDLFVALITVLSAVLLGRVFCGWVCPMGTTIDLTERAVYGKRKSKDQKKNLQWLKYFVLAAIVLPAIFGINLSYYLDPIPLITRIYTVAFYPFIMGLLDLSVHAFSPVADKLDLTSLKYIELKPPVYNQVFLTLGIFLGVIGLSRISPRFFCRNLCPLGALLGVCSRFSLLGKHVSNDCTDCKTCERVCPTGAVIGKTWADRESECIKCFVCQDECPVEAIKYNFKGKTLREVKTDLGRRRLLEAGALGLTAGVLAHQSADLKNRPDRLVRPPGAPPEAEFLAKCTRCGQCVKVCPTYVIQSQGLEQGMIGVFAPKLTMRVAGCDQECRACGVVCPTNALRELTLEEKKYAKLGTAALDQSRCLVYAWNKECLVCDEICPYNAIVFRKQNGRRVPVVIPSRCNGCGWCEQACPVLGESAIKVSPAGEIRLSKGSYKEEALNRGIDLSAKDSDEEQVENPEKTPQNEFQ
jgi:ferredoxin-type protein NapF